jgi:signal transduction histidine kinase
VVALPAGVDLAAYRIVQEALTNALRHSGGTRATVDVTYGTRQVEIAVRDDGAATAGGHEPGHGLIGMRERAALYGGRLDAGPDPDGGFRVDARLPLDPVAT